MLIKYVIVSFLNAFGKHSILQYQSYSFVFILTNSSPSNYFELNKYISHLLDPIDDVKSIDRCETYRIQ